MNARTKAVVCLLASILISVCAWLGTGLSWKEQEPIYSALLQVSAIIFGVMGLWMAVLYPNDLRQLVRETNGKAGEIRRIKPCLDSMIWATAIVAATLLVQLFAPVMKQVEILYPFHRQVRGLSMAFVTFLVVTQIWTLLLTLVPLNCLDGNISRAVQSEESGKRRTGQASRKRKPWT